MLCMEISRSWCINEYIQNCTNWCWAVACRMVGEQFKRNNPFYDFRLNYGEEITEEDVVRTGYSNILSFAALEGIRTDVVRQKDGLFLLDEWQRMIVRSANSEHPGVDGNWPGDDTAKEKGIRYVVTGLCDSSLVEVVSMGNFDSDKSLLYYHYSKLRYAFLQNNYVIGNAVLYPKRVCHSFVLMDWTEEDKILIYDPWDGHFEFYTVADVFCNGISGPLGTGIIKWVQCIL